MNAILSEIRLVLRSLVINRGFTAFAALSLALGIGVTTVMFTLAYGVLFKTLPYPDPDQLVRVQEDASRTTVSTGAFMDWKENNQTFEVLCSSALAQRTMTGLAHPKAGIGLAVSSDFLNLLRIKPLLGRTFLPEEGLYGGDNKEVVLTYPFWKAQFGGSTNVVGEFLGLDGIRHRIIGVLPPRALFYSDTQFIIPRIVSPEMRESRDWPNCLVFGRLKPATTLAQAENDLRMIKRNLQSTYPKSKDAWQAVLIPLSKDLNSSSRPMLLMLLGGAICTLITACVNVTHLQLARMVRRQKEIAIRVAIGASRWRILRLVLVENLLLYDRV